MALKGRPAAAPGPLAQIDSLARTAAPGLATLAAMILAAAPVGLPSLVAPIALACVCFWSIFRPASMPAPAAFALGLVQDLLGFAPLGIGALTLLVAHLAALRTRRVLVRQSFLLVWLTYCAFAALAVVLGYLLFALLAWQVPPLQPAAAQLALSVGVYPPIAGLMAWALRGMQRAEAEA